MFEDFRARSDDLSIVEQHLLARLTFIVKVNMIANRDIDIFLLHSEDNIDIFMC